MIYLNEQIKKLYDITEEDYLEYCKTHNLFKSKKENVIKFITHIRREKLRSIEERANKKEYIID